MKLHIITIGQPKLAYARAGWEEYFGRLKHYYALRVTHLSDKFVNDADKILETAGSSYKVILEIEGKLLSSPELGIFLAKRELEAREVSFVIGGPGGLPQSVITQADFQWSLSQLTLPHDLAMVVVLEALYRASTINSGQSYHK